MGNYENSQGIDEVVALLRIIATPELDRIRAEMSEKPIHQAVLDSTTDEWAKSGDLKREIAKKHQVSEKSVQRASADLVARGLLAQQGSGPNREYKSRGLL